MHRLWFIVFGLSCIGLIATVLLSIRDRRGNIGIATLFFLALLVATMVGGMASFLPPWQVADLIVAVGLYSRYERAGK